MWIYTQHRGEHDNRFIINLDQSSRVNLTHLGERWFIEVVVGSDTIPIAQVEHEKEAHEIIGAVFHGLRERISAIDLEHLSEPSESDGGPTGGRATESAEARPAHMDG